MPEALPHAEIVHAIQGRSRLRIPARRGDSVFFASLATGLSTLQGVRKIEVRPLTGSILIHHDAPLDHIAKMAEEVRLFVLAAGGRAPAAVQALPLDARMVAAFGFGALALLQIARGKVLPQAATLAWYAANLTGALSGGSAEAGGLADADGSE